MEHELSVPFASAVLGGEAQIAVRRGDGRTETIHVKIPAGIESGKKIRLRGQGEPGDNGGPAGDILIRVDVAPHPVFRRHGKRLEVTVPITLAEALAGGKIDVPTPHGTITLTVPPGSSSGRKLRVKGHGVKAGKASPATCSRSCRSSAQESVGRRPPAARRHREEVRRRSAGGAAVVSGLGLAPMIAAASLLAEAAGGEKLPPPTRAAVLMALIGIALLGMLLVVIILLGGHWVRRQGSYRRGPAVPPDRRPIVGDD